MKEAELLVAGLSAYANSLAAFAVYVTMLSGYLVVAYMAANQMTRPQTIIVNILYSLLSAVIAAAFYNFAQAGYENTQLAIAMSTQRVVGPMPMVAETALVVIMFCYLASLKFMWDARHQQNE